VLVILARLAAWHLAPRPQPAGQLYEGGHRAAPACASFHFFLTSADTLTSVSL
jgi:hypothetical protein